jgi:tRNA modification GTPase
MLKETIAAISTPMGWGGIGIIRISGQDTFSIIDKVFKSARSLDVKEIPTQTMKYGYIVDKENKEEIDEVLVSFFKKPNTYTREDMAEINCHGGLVIQKRILELVVQNGARLADPGEFTKRAFLNGRIDLSQAEAVIEMINAKTDFARKASLNQLEGKLSKRIKDIRTMMVGSIADIEANIDYPEYDIPEVSKASVLEKMTRCLEAIEMLTDTFFEGKMIREGIKIAIIGKPNVGKSSLLNALIQKEKAIITDIPGTTRDVVEEYAQIAGIAVHFLDTAGLRETQDVVEKIGIDKTKEAIGNADLILLVLDVSKPLTQEDREIFELVKDKKIIVLLNKIDLEKAMDVGEIKKQFEDKPVIDLSAKEEIGLDEIEAAISKMFVNKDIHLDSENIITNIRHKEIIEQVKNELKEAIGAIKAEVPIDILSSSMTEAANKLGEITGETVNEEVLNTIFHKFCIGK